MDLKYMNFKDQNGIGRAHFNRPEKLNALNTDVFRDLETIMSCCEDDDTIRVVIFTGNEKAFVAGADIENMSKGDIRSAYELTDLTMRVQERLADLPKPTIAAISGYALGAGCEVALCCDFRIASQNAVFGLPVVKLRIIPGYGSTQRLPRIIGIAKAKELLFTGEQISADEELSIGLVNQAVDYDQLDGTVEKFADKLIALPPLSLRSLKEAIQFGMQMDLESAIRMESYLFANCFGSEDRIEGVRAFLEKRKPKFKGF